jgi:hypothetical protein
MLVAEGIKEAFKVENLSKIGPKMTQNNSIQDPKST